MASGAAPSGCCIELSLCADERLGGGKSDALGVEVQKHRKTITRPHTNVQQMQPTADFMDYII